jgi:hypothetical protein
MATGLLRESVSALVAPAARAQMFKGLFSFGATTAAQYVRHKISRRAAAIR